MSNIFYILISKNLHKIIVKKSLFRQDIRYIISFTLPFGKDFQVFPSLIYVRIISKVANKVDLYC